MAVRDDIDPTIVRELFDYDPTTGILTWRKPAGRHGRIPAGSPVGGRHNDYRAVRIFGRFHRIHRIAWAHFYGRVPRGYIDHVDGDKLNNAISNLRESTASQNKANERRRSNNTSGLKGVSFDRRRGRWSASITSEGKPHWLGYFDDPRDAHAAYAIAAETLFGRFANAG